MAYMAVVFFLFGLAVGSFLNVLIYRHNTGVSVLVGRSRCFSCGRDLNWYELVPLLSFIVQRGRCRMCKSKISLQYPAVELLTGIMAALFYTVFLAKGISTESILQFAFHFIVGAILIVIAVYDLKHKIIPDFYVYSFIAIAAVLAVLTWVGLLGSSFRSIQADLLTTIALFVFFAALWFFSGGRAMGFGDAKLAVGIGLFLGFPAALGAVVYAFWIGAVVGIGLLLLRYRSLTMKSEIPFAPFLVLGTFLGIFFGFDILHLLTF